MVESLLLFETLSSMSFKTGVFETILLASSVSICLTLMLMERRSTTISHRDGSYCVLASKSLPSDACTISVLEGHSREMTLRRSFGESESRHIYKMSIGLSFIRGRRPSGLANDSSPSLVTKVSRRLRELNDGDSAGLPVGLLRERPRL